MPRFRDGVRPLDDLHPRSGRGVGDGGPAASDPPLPAALRDGAAMGRPFSPARPRPTELAALALWRERRHTLAVYSGVIFLVFAYTLVDNCIGRPDGLIIGSVFTVLLMLASGVSRSMRSMEIRIPFGFFGNVESWTLGPELRGKKVHLVLCGGSLRRRGHRQRHCLCQREHRSHLDLHQPDPARFDGAGHPVSRMFASKTLLRPMSSPRASRRTSRQVVAKLGKDERRVG